MLDIVIQRYWKLPTLWHLEAPTRNTIATAFSGAVGSTLDSPGLKDIRHVGWVFVVSRVMSFVHCRSWVKVLLQIVVSSSVEALLRLELRHWALAASYAE